MADIARVVICFQISIFEPLNTATRGNTLEKRQLWFAFKLVSVNHWIQPLYNLIYLFFVVICFQISIFEPLNTARRARTSNELELWFAFKLVSLNHWIQRAGILITTKTVVICFQISIFEPLNTAERWPFDAPPVLWFAFKLVSLNHWIQHFCMLSIKRSSCDLLSN